MSSEWCFTLPGSLHHACFVVKGGIQTVRLSDSGCFVCNKAMDPVTAPPAQHRRINQVTNMFLRKLEGPDVLAV